MAGIFFFLLICGVVGIVVAACSSAGKASSIAAPPNYRVSWGLPNPAMVCPHCQTKGSVCTKTVTAKMGISGAKATGAILTGGASVLATGLSRKENLTEAHCGNCNSSWRF